MEPLVIVAQKMADVDQFEFDGRLGTFAEVVVTKKLRHSYQLVNLMV